MNSYRPRFIWATSLVAAMGGLLFGYDWVVIGGAKPFYEKFFGLTSPSAIGWAMSSALVGCLVGALVSGGLSDRFGRKKLLILAGFLFTISAVGTALAGGFSVFVVCRLVGGVGIGLASNLSPMYIAEISPAAMRGKLVSVNQLTIVIGILAAQIVNWLIAEPVPAGATAADILASWNGQVSRAAVIASFQGDAVRSMTLARFLRPFSCYGGSLSSLTSGADGPLPGTLPSFRQVPDGV